MAEVQVLQLPDGADERIKCISQQRQNVIQALAQQSKKAAAIPDPAKETVRSLNQRLDLLLQCLDEQLQMTPEVRARTKIDLGLKLIFDNAQFHFSDQHRRKAQDLYDKWAEENWGADEVVDESTSVKAEDTSENERSESLPKRRRTHSDGRRASSGADELAELATLRLPPESHPIYGKGGIMHGVAYTHGQRKTPMLDPRYSKRNARVYGHNGLRVGAWYPMRLKALFEGAHGSAQAGIAGNPKSGAYSIVVSGHYDDLDKDLGEVLYYSGSNSHDNEDPKAPPSSTAGTLALHASLSSGRSVRVLRTSTGKSEWVPTCGLRYDGLYQVVSKREPLNTRGGRYEQFKLCRLEDQVPIDRSRPDASEVRDFNRMSQYY